MLTKQEQDWSPFVGPRPFRRDDEDQQRFFGRDDETEQILSLIYGHQLVLIYAQSGAGKTSILNAKVTPELQKNGFEVLPTARVGVGSTTTLSSDSEVVTTLSPHNTYVLNTLEFISRHR